MVKLSSKIIIAFIFMLASLNLNGATLQLDKSHSYVGFSIKHLMISNVKGEFQNYSGDLEFDPQTKKFTKFNATVEAKSIDTGIKKRDDHLRSADFFNVEKFPELTFTMNSHESDGNEGVLKGDLTIHGVTQPMKFNVEYNGMVKDHRGNTKVGFTIDGKINRKDFGLTWNKVLEAGGVAVGDRVKILIEIEAIVK